MKKNLTVGSWLILAFVLVLTLAACQAGAGGPDQEEPVEETEEESTAPEETIQTQGEISKDILLDPALADPEEKDSARVNRLVYEGLVRLDDYSSLTSALATSWTVSDDGLDYIFSLQPDVVFHDGTPVDADAVIANFNRWFDPEDPLHGSGSYGEWVSAFLGFKGETGADGMPRSTFDGIEKVDNLTVLIHLSREDPDLLLKLNSLAFSIASPNVLADEGDKYGTLDGSAVGTGPYMVSERTGDKLILLPNHDYWGEIPETGLEYPLR